MTDIDPRKQADLELEADLNEQADLAVVAPEKTSLRKDKRGVTMLEYTMLTGLLVLASIAIWQAFKTSLSEAVGSMGEAVESFDNAYDKVK